MQQTSNPELWNQMWSRSSKETYNQDFWDWVKRESTGVRGIKIQDYIRTHLGNIEGLKTIEVGSGPGVYSFIFARLGAHVTLLDYSPEALQLAREQFDAEGLEATFLLQDALQLEPTLLNQYDAAMSFGTVEHFRYPERLKMFEVHLNLVRRGGAIVISTPNQAFWPHELLKAYLQRQHKWDLGYEGAFARREFFNLARQLGLNHIKIIGSAVRSDLNRYYQIYRSTNLLQRLLGPTTEFQAITDRASWCDDYLGADLVLMGTKDYE